jgi:hypothetical protein
MGPVESKVRRIVAQSRNWRSSFTIVVSLCFQEQHARSCHCPWLLYDLELCAFPSRSHPSHYSKRRWSLRLIYRGYGSSMERQTGTTNCRVRKRQPRYASVRSGCDAAVSRRGVRCCDGCDRPRYGSFQSTFAFVFWLKWMDFYNINYGFSDLPTGCRCVQSLVRGGEGNVKERGCSEFDRSNWRHKRHRKHWG